MKSASPIIADLGPFAERIAHYDDPQAAMRAMLALDAGQMGSWSWDIVNGTVMGDPYLAELFGLDYDAQPWPVDDAFARVHPDDMQSMQAALNRALTDVGIYHTEFRVVEDGDPRWLGGRGNVTERDLDGAPLRMIGVNWDATHQKQQEERLAMLAGEMDHRVKNAFAVIRALINIGVNTSSDKVNFADTLRSQVEAMASAHALSTKTARNADLPNAPVPVGQVLTTALSPWMASGISQIILDIPSDFMLPPRQISAVSMLAYELATNAAKYGPLGERGGSLTVCATLDAGGTAILDWREDCAYPSLSVGSEEADNDGFGSVLLNHCAATLRADVTRKMTAGGLHFRLVIPYPAK